MRTFDDGRGRRAGRGVSGMDERRGRCDERDVKSAPPRGGLGCCSLVLCAYAQNMRADGAASCRQNFEATRVQVSRQARAGYYPSTNTVTTVFGLYVTVTQ